MRRRKPRSSVVATATPNGASALRTRIPTGMRFGHVTAQVVVLLAAGFATAVLFAASPLLQALTAPVVPTVIVPPGFELDLAVPLAFLLPLALGIPLTLSRHRAPLLLWLGIMSVVAIISVLEVSRLNWISLAGGIAFRFDAALVPLMRTFAGLLLLLCGVLLLGQQSVHDATLLMAERGVALRELRTVRGAFLRLERLVVLAALGAGAVLTAVVAVSMEVASGPPDEGHIVPAMVWVAASVLVIVLGLVLLTRRRQQPQ